MEQFSSSNNPSHNLNGSVPESNERSLQNPNNTQEAHEYVPKFIHIQEDLQNLFNIEVTSERSLSYPWVKDELYAKVVEDLKVGKPFALDYMFEETLHDKQLLSREDLQARGIEKMKPEAKEILARIKGPIGRRMKDLIVNAGILTEEEADTAFIAS